MKLVDFLVKGGWALDGRGALHLINSGNATINGLPATGLANCNPEDKIEITIKTIYRPPIHERLDALFKGELSSRCLDNEEDREAVIRGIMGLIDSHE